MKEKLNILIQIFTRVVTAIFLIASIYITIFNGTEQVLSVKDIWAIMIIAAASALFYIPLLSEKSFSKPVMFTLQILYFLAVNITTLITAAIRGWFSLQNPVTLASFELVVISVYALVMFISYKIDSASAKKMNKRLKERQETFRD
jgi:hypothetical protein